MKKPISKNRQVIFVVIALFVVAITAAAVYYGSLSKAKRAIFNNERAIKETPAVRAIDRVSAMDGSLAAATGEAVALVGGARVVIEGGKTLKESYVIAEPSALAWSTDAKLVYIRSLGTVTVDGVSSGWEVVFGSATLKKGYMVAVVNGAIIETKEVVSASSGYTLPKNWYDADDAIKTLQALPQFKDVKISGLNFYNEGGRGWGYAVYWDGHSESIPVR